MKLESPARKPILDISRFVAALSVCVFHWYLTDFSWAELNAFVVDYFFILSGFVLQPSIFARQSSKKWILRRIIRIWIPLIPTITLISILISLNVQSATTIGEGNFLVSILIALFLLQTFYPPSVALNTPLWSLSAEFITNLIVILVPKRKRPFVFLAIAGLFISIITGIIIHLKFPGLGIFHSGIALGRCLTNFSIGIILKITINRTNKIAQTSLICSMTMAACIIFPLFLMNKLFIIFAPMMLAPLLLLLDRVDLKQDSYAGKVAGKLGEASYIIYLFHIPFQSIKEYLTASSFHNIPQLILRESLSLVFFLVLCQLFSEFIEIPIRRKLMMKLNSNRD